MLFKLQRYFFLIVVLIITVVILRCDKTPVGYDELERDISNPEFNEFRPTNRFCYGKYVPLGDANYFVLGKNQEYEARILMQFPFPDTTINLDSVSSARLVLYPKRYENISFKVHPIQTSSEWKENNATWKRMDEAVPWMADGGDYYPTVLAEGALTSDSCVITLNRNKLDTIVNHCNGLIIVPEQSVQSFATINSRNISSKAPKIVFQFLNNTTKTYTPTQDCHIIDTLDLVLLPTELWVGSGFPFRTMLKFNLDTIPENVTIASAELSINIQSHYSISDTLSIGIWKLKESTFDAYTSFADIISNQTQFIVSTDTIVTFDIRRIVQSWNSKPDSNFGILLSVYPENYEISRIKIKTGSYMPKLKVGYILPPKGRF